MALALALVAALSVGACGSDDNSTSPRATTSGSPATTAPSSGTTASATATSAAAGDQTIAIQGFKYSPTPLPTKTGKVTLVNLDDNVPHSATADDKSFDTGVFTKANGPKTITLSRTGTFNYRCQVHDFMRGTIQVS